MDFGAEPNLRERPAISSRPQQGAPGPFPVGWPQPGRGEGTLESKPQETGREVWGQEQVQEQEPEQKPATRWQYEDIPSYKLRLNRPWHEAQADQIPRHSQTRPHKLKNPEVGVRGDPTRRTGDRRARGIAKPRHEVGSHDTRYRA